MQVKSLGYTTDLIFPAFDGEIIDRGDYLVVKTPSNPGFHWGNFLLFPNPPRDGDLDRWSKIFDTEMSAPNIKHTAIGWDTTQGELGNVQQFLDAGFEISRDVVLTAVTMFPVSSTLEGIELRDVDSDADWHQVLENQVACRDPKYEESSFRNFYAKLFERYRAMVVAGLGNWYGAFLSDQLIADLGVFHDNGIGRFQLVETLPDFRRRGIASALIIDAANRAMDIYDLKMLVIVAEEKSPAERLYQSLGFAPVERQVELVRSDP